MPISFDQFVGNMNNAKIPEWSIVLLDKANPTGRGDRITVRAKTEQEARYIVENHLYGGIYGVKTIQKK